MLLLLISGLDLGAARGLPLLTDLKEKLYNLSFFNEIRRLGIGDFNSNLEKYVITIISHKFRIDEASVALRPDSLDLNKVNKGYADETIPGFK